MRKFSIFLSSTISATSSVFTSVDADNNLNFLHRQSHKNENLNHHHHRVNYNHHQVKIPSDAPAVLKLLFTESESESKHPRKHNKHAKAHRVNQHPESDEKNQMKSMFEPKKLHHKKMKHWQELRELGRIDTYNKASRSKKTKSKKLSKKSHNSKSKSKKNSSFKHHHKFNHSNSKKSDSKKSDSKNSNPALTTSTSTGPGVTPQVPSASISTASTSIPQANDTPVGTGCPDPILYPGKYAECIIKEVKGRVERMKAIETNKEEFCEDAKKKILEENLPETQNDIKEALNEKKVIVAKLVKCTRQSCNNICAGYDTSKFEQCQANLNLERVEKEEEIRSCKKRVDLLKDQADALEGWCAVGTM